MGSPALSPALPGAGQLSSRGGKEAGTHLCNHPPPERWGAGRVLPVRSPLIKRMKKGLNGIGRTPLHLWWQKARRRSLSSLGTNVQPLRARELYLFWTLWETQYQLSLGSSAQKI